MQVFSEQQHAKPTHGLRVPYREDTSSSAFSGISGRRQLQHLTFPAYFVWISPTFRCCCFFPTVLTNNNKHCPLQLFRGWELSLSPAVAADDDNCASADSNPAMSFAKKDRGVGYVKSSSHRLLRVSISRNPNSQQHVCMHLGLNFNPTNPNYNESHKLMLCFGDTA